MNKLTLFVISIVCCSIVAKAQLLMTIQVPPVGLIVKPQLWNIILVSSDNQPISATISLSLIRKKNNQPVLAAETGTFILSKGAKQFKGSDFPSIQYSYFSTAINRDPNGFLPLGSYLACYTVTTINHNEKQVLAEECIPVDIEPLSPPLLNSPADATTIENVFPHFNWLPPSPFNMFSSLEYEICVTEVLKGQPPLQAVQQNLPIYSTLSTSSALNYPSSARALDTGKLYAWKVTALDNGETIGQSEVWTFKVTKATPIASNDASDAYYKLGKGMQMPYVASSGVLKFEYINDANEAVVKYSITEVAKVNGEPIVKDESLNLQYGQNLTFIKLPKGLKQGTLYQFSFLNARNEQWGMLFTYSDPQKK